MQNKSDVRSTGIQSLCIPSTLRNVDVFESTCLPSIIVFEAETAQILFKAARLFASLTVITIPASVEVLCESCFSSCKSLSRVTFAAGSCLKRIEKEAFSMCESLKEIEIPASVEVLCDCRQDLWEAGDDVKTVDCAFSSWGNGFFAWVLAMLFFIKKFIICQL